MPRKSFAFALSCLGCIAVLRAAAAESTAFPLMASRQVGDVTDVTVAVEVGGEIIAEGDDGQETRLPMSVVAKLDYAEQLLAWPEDAASPTRSIRHYSRAQATLKTKDQGVERTLLADRQTVVAELGPDGAAFNGLDQTLLRDEFDLINIVGNSLAIDRLLPGRELQEGEGWDHDAATIGALLGMDHVAVCEVRSVITGEKNRQVQIRLAGTVHGTVEGAATEMDLRGAYLYHLDERRITKFNLAIKEIRKAGEVSPGLDVVAKINLTAKPLVPPFASPFDQQQLESAAAHTSAALRELAVEAPARGYRFRHDNAWYVTAEKRELMSLRLMAAGGLLAHCNVTTLPPRSPDAPATLETFEADVAKALGESLDKVAAATEWTTETGLKCLGVLANGAVEDVPMQWRYYHLSDASGAQATVAVTVEQSLLERFADADRPIVESIELLELPTRLKNPAETATLKIKSVK